MFIKLSTTDNKPCFVNMQRATWLAVSTWRAVIKVAENVGSVQPLIPVTVIYFTEEDFIRVLETPEQILALLSAGSP